jgi:hypothetical protein
VEKRWSQREGKCRCDGLKKGLGRRSRKGQVEDEAVLCGGGASEKRVVRYNQQVKIAGYDSAMTRLEDNWTV